MTLWLEYMISKLYLKTFQIYTSTSHNIWNLKSLELNYALNPWNSIYWIKFNIISSLKKII